MSLWQWYWVGVAKFAKDVEQCMSWFGLMILQVLSRQSSWSLIKEEADHKKNSRHMCNKNPYLDRLVIHLELNA